MNKTLALQTVVNGYVCMVSEGEEWYVVKSTPFQSVALEWFDRQDEAEVCVVFVHNGQAMVIA